MSVKQINHRGQMKWRVYVKSYARLPSGELKPVQKNLLFDKEDEARREAKRWRNWVNKEAARLEGNGLLFKDVLYRWEVESKFGYTGRKLDETTIKDHVNRVQRYCTDWMDSPAGDLTRGDGRDVLRLAKSQGASVALQRRIKTSINCIFDWGIEEKLIKGVHKSPVYGLHLEEDDDDEKVPPIITLKDVKKLLKSAKAEDHPWYHVWAFAILTGMRSGELFALKWNSIFLEKRTIRVYQSYSRRSRKTKGTKAGYWRNVPISPHLMTLFNELKEITGDTEFVLPRVSGWDDGYAAKHLRMYMTRLGIDTQEDRVVFHTLRACFATHLLASGAEPAKVMKIGGWKDFKTFEIYIRLSGVDEQGVTDKLSVLPNEEDILDHVQSMYEVAS